MSELCHLSLDDVEIDQRRLWILGKGQHQTLPVTIPDQVLTALQQWLRIRGGSDPQLPVFIALDRVHHGHRLTSRSVHRLIVHLGHQAGVTTWPHGLRHSAITAALNAGSDVRSVRHFSRHASLDTILLYDDARHDMGGQVAQSVANALGKNNQDQNNS